MTDTTRTFSTGDTVYPVADKNIVNWPKAAVGQPFKVTKVTKTGLEASPIDRDGNPVPGGRGIRGNHEWFAADRFDALSVPIAEPIFEGTIVTLNRTVAKTDIVPDVTPMVVVRDNTGRSDKLRVVKLGGGSGFAYINVMPNGVTVRDATWLAEQVLDAATS